MSIRIMSQIWEYAKVTGSELLVLLAMADFADDHGRNVYPSMTTLAHKARLSESQARRVVHELCDQGVIEVIEMGGWDGKRNRANEYRIVLDNENLSGDGGGSMMIPPSADAPTGGINLTPQSSRPRAHGGRADAPTGGSAHATTVVAPTRPYPSLQPSLHPPLIEENNNNALRALTLEEAETAVVVVGVDSLIAKMDHDQKMALLSWLWLYNGWNQEDLSLRDIFRRAYKGDPFDGMKNPAAVMISKGKAKEMAPLIADDREDMNERLRVLQEATP